MKQEHKELLLKDLCARLPYGVVCHIENASDFEDLLQPYDDKVSFGLLDRFRGHQFDLKPYLRPMYSMTDEEKKEVSALLNYEFYVDDDYALAAEDDRHRIGLDLMMIYIDWLNEHQFDYRGLIEKGLALEAPEGMYKTE